MRKSLIISLVALAMLCTNKYLGANPVFKLSIEKKFAEKTVLVASHRGDWRNAPENSIQAIKNCIEMGVDMVEIDIRKTKDGQLILMHDATIDRTTTGKGKVEELTLNEINSYFLKNGAGHKTRHKVATLKDALIAAKDKILINIDKGVDYFEEVIKIVNETDTKGQVLVKSGYSYDTILSLYPTLFNSVAFMPVISLDNPSSVCLIDDYIKKYNPIAFEINYSQEYSFFDEVIRKVADSKAKIFMNSLWPELCAEHDDDIAVESNMPEKSWGWLIRKGAGIIQTDRPAKLIEYLDHNNINIKNKRIYVDPEAQFHGDGTKHYPFNDIKLGVENASVGDTVLIKSANCIYTSSGNKPIYINKDLTLIGGFDSSYQITGDNTCIIGNDGISRLFEIEAGVEVTISNINVSNFNMFNGQSDDVAAIVNRGILNLENFVLKDNIRNGSSISAVIYNIGSLKANKCIFLRNTGSGDGGAIYNDSHGYLILNECNFENNISKAGSAVFVKSLGKCLVSSSSFVGNTSETYGTVTFYNKELKIESTFVNNTFANNSVEGNVQGKSNIGGSALYWWGDVGSVLSVINNTVTCNSTIAFDKNGNVSPNLGGAVVVRGGNLRVNNNFIAGNYSGSGFGDVFLHEGTSVNGDYNVYSLKESVNYPMALHNECFSGRRPLSSGLNDFFGIICAEERFITDLELADNGTKYLEPLTSSVSEISMKAVKPSNLMEAVLGVDINNNGSFSDILLKDQIGRNRNVSELSWIGAIEGSQESSVNNLNISEDCDFRIENGYLLLPKHGDFNFMLFDINGFAIDYYKNVSSDKKLKLKKLKPGLYIGILQAKDERFKEIKFCVD